MTTQGPTAPVITMDPTLGIPAEAPLPDILAPPPPTYVTPEQLQATKTLIAAVSNASTDGLPSCDRTKLIVSGPAQLN